MRRGAMVRWALLLAMVLVGAACGTAPGEPGTDAAPTDPADPESTEEPAAAPELRLVATLAPLADLVAMVGGDRVEVSSLVPAGADAHTYEPRPSDVAALADADAFVGIGLDLNAGAVALAAENLSDDAILLIAEHHLDEGDLLRGHTHGEDGEDGEMGHTHGRDGEARAEDDHTHDDAEPAGPNPHVWTGLGLAADLVDGIAEELSALDPDGAEGYRERAADARAQIEDLRERVTAAVETIPEGNRTLVVYHDAWGYFARDHGLELVTAVQPSDYAEPSAGEVRAIVDLIREHEVPALFGSEEFASGVLDVIAEETGATYVGDLADDELPGEPGDPDHTYLQMMRRNAALIVTHLGGDAGALED